MLSPTALIDRFEENAAFVQRVFGEIPEERLRERRVADKWSAHENLAHLGQFHQAIRDRVNWIVTQDNPTFERYQPDADPGTRAWAAKPSARMLADFVTARRDLVEFLRGLPAEAWARPGTHGTFGTLTLAGWLEFWLQHEGHHIYVAMVRAKT
ncbi:DinB family protein [Deinococcus pimensis]|uniref:DinB family protein n=1 Tax=Deinococcus pimensis TaxID=309888 RepID=UPI00048725BF|nr:DinB family protein [Deinococcus pimensis]